MTTEVVVTQSGDTSVVQEQIINREKQKLQIKKSKVVPMVPLASVIEEE